MGKSDPAKEIEQDDGHLDEAIEELREVLHEEPETGPVTAGENSELVMGIPVEVQIVLGSAEMPVSELMALRKGSTVSLDRRVGEPVDIVVNGRRIARGEITLLQDDPNRFGVRLTEISKAAAQ
ncbi:flagellar motor switch protein FliN [Chelativorans sp. YIM 93263]|uniref:flagellar motor switch protein FliN n=1 Tax=Chelativorans sp. YIM 93263 TaxID=2906648 RepID=UPI002379999D|nr:flagellar motor switch protein FliN [Chelativorans sp. YIM 93263]